MSTVAVMDGPAAEAARFELRLQPLYRDAVRLAYGLLRDSSLAEDAAQEAALRAWRHRGRLREGSDLRPWFLAIVVNCSRDLRRSPWWRRRAELPPVERPDAGGDAGYSAEIGDLRQALLRLPDRDRLIIVLRFYLDLPHEEVAAITGMSVEAVRVRTYRALRRLRIDLASEDV
ncbi:MAG TPA: sigma-70 family RNA polymerase sigma factor [Candidatus Binatia bacterium]|nr:sigma-70 family RNA polymerase sigma factor [Candidatus Binatia bacterium]